MGQFHKEMVGTDMGKPSSHEKIKPKIKDSFGGNDFKKGAVMDLPAHDDSSWPKKGRINAGKDLRDSEIRKGSI